MFFRCYSSRPEWRFYRRGQSERSATCGNSQSSIWRYAFWYAFLENMHGIDIIPLAAGWSEFLFGLGRVCAVNWIGTDALATVHGAPPGVVGIPDLGRSRARKWRLGRARGCPPAFQ